MFSASVGIGKIKLKIDIRPPGVFLWYYRQTSGFLFLISHGLVCLILAVLGWEEEDTSLIPPGRLFNDNDNEVYCIFMPRWD